ncbi:MAG: hypothetical protein JRG96_15055 [Deltaproteobacteria bacterium]|nr:hypothetical protein [Deltaproteobacteria bacterium]
MGKSSLLRVLPGMLGEGYRCALLRGSRGGSSGDAVDAWIAGAFRLEGEGLSREALVSRREDGRRLVLLVDDADRLTSQVLERVAALPDCTDAAGRPLVQVVISADLDRRERESWSPLLAWIDPFWIVRLDTLTPDSMHLYLDRRMRQAGWRGRTLFSETAALAVHRRTGGNPGSVSRLCSELLDLASADGISTIDADFVLRAAPGAAASPPPPSPPAASSIDSALARQPLTADSIRNAPSLDLAD